MSEQPEVLAGEKAQPEPAMTAEDKPYHLLVRNEAHRWWRPLVALLVLALLEIVSLIAGLLVLGAVVALPGGFEAERIVVYFQQPQLVKDLMDHPSPMVQLFMGFALIIAMLPPVLLTARWVQKRPAGTVASVAGRLRWRWLGECVLLALVPYAAAFAIMATYDLVAGAPGGGSFPGLADYTRILLMAVLVVPVQCATEEFVFRGILLQTLTAWFRTPWPGIVLCSLLFLSGHGYVDPLAVAELFLMALVVSWLTIRTGGLEAAIGLHVANNSLSVIVGGLSGVPNMEQGGEYPLMQVLPLALASITYAWLADRRAARRKLVNTTGGRVHISPWSLEPAAPATAG